MEQRHELPSFEIIYADHSKMVFNLCLNYVKNEAIAADVCQDVFIKIHGKLNLFRGDSSLKTWVYRLTINTCLDYLKAQKRKKRLGQFFSFSTDKSVSNTLTEFNHPGVQLEFKEKTAQIFYAIDQLPKRQKTALLLQITENMNLQEIAEIMETTTKAVESILGRARLTLKKIIVTSEG